MELKGIITIAGMSGLYKMVAQAKNSVIVESFIDKKRTPVPPTYRISSLEDISVFTNNGDLPLLSVFKKIKEKEKDKQPIDPKSAPSDLKNYFKSILPDIDEQRVYPSDMKKILSWYHLLKDQIPTEELQKEESASEESKHEKAVKEEKKNVSVSESKEKINAKANNKATKVKTQGFKSTKSTGHTKKG